MRRAGRVALAMAVAAGAAMGAAGAARAATVSVTDDGGNPLALGGPVTIRNMNVRVGVTFGSDEVAQKRDYTLEVLDPTGQVAAAQSTCLQASGTGSGVSPEYRANGTYTVVLRTYADTASLKDACKANPSELRLAYTVAASAPVGPLAPRALIREPGSSATRPLVVPVSVNPGAFTTELRYAAGGVIGPDGAISGASDSAFVIAATGRATAYLREPGRYVFVARATRNGAFTPWSPPVFVDVFAPFDFSFFSFLDSRGPSYRLQATLREKTATGRVRIYLARGKRGRYRRIGTVSIRRGTITKRFRQRRTGRYRMRFVYGGTATTAPGRVVEGVRFTRRVVIR